MKTLQIDESKARQLYKKASPEFQITLEHTFGKDFFSEKITDRVKTYEDACAELEEVPVDVEDMLARGFTMDEINYRKIKTITRALNEGWVPDWNNQDQQKWVPWFKVSSSGFVFGDTRYLYSFALAGYGSRLCFKSSDLAAYAGKQFIELYKDFIL